MDSKTGNIILVAMIAGAVLGVLGGYFFGDILLQIKFLGTIFLNALKMVVIPLIVASMIVGVTSLGDIRKLGKTTGKTLLYYFATTGFSVLIGLILVNIIRPGIGVATFGSHVPDLVAESTGKTFVDVVVSLIPDNLFGAAAEGQILPLIIFSLLFGGVLTTLGAKGKPVINFFDGLNRAIMKLVTLILYFAPVGVLALIGGIVAENRNSVDELVSGLGLYALTVIGGLLIHALVILPLILKFMGKKNPFRYFLNMGQSLATAFTTASSSATLPITMECVEDKNQVDSRASSFVLPLGATINMDGTALYEAVAAMFIAQIYGIDLSLGQQVVIFLTATLASIGAAGIPHAGTVTMVFVLSAVGLPLEGIGLIWAVDWFLDRCRTTVNVWGDSIGAAVIGETSEMQDQRRGRVRTDKDQPHQKVSRSEKKPPYKHSDRDSQTRDSRFRDRKQQRSPYKTRDDKRGGMKDRHHSQPYNQKKGQAPPSGPRDDIRKGGDQKPSRPVQPPHPAPDLKVKMTNETVMPSKATMNRELEKVRRQLSGMEKGKGGDSGKPPVEDRKKDDFFDIDMAKFDFFGDEKKDQTGDKPKSDISDAKPRAGRPEPKRDAKPERRHDSRSKPEAKPEPKPEQKPEPKREQEVKVEKVNPAAGIPEDSPAEGQSSWGRKRRGYRPLKIGDESPKEDESNGSHDSEKAESSAAVSLASESTENGSDDDPKDMSWGRHRSKKFHSETTAESSESAEPVPVAAEKPDLGRESESGDSEGHSSAVEQIAGDDDQGDSWGRGRKKSPGK